MESFFIAIIFVCVNGSCNFVYSQAQFNTKEKCLQVLDAQLKDMEEKTPVMAAQGACLGFKQRGA